MAGAWKQITQEEARERMARRDGHVIVDVRHRDEYELGHIPGAILVVNEEIGIEKPEKLPDLDQILLVYCRSGRRSKQAAEKLARIGYTHIFEFGGILDWTGEIVAGAEPGGIEAAHPFRQMRRFKQQISGEECRAVLKETKRGGLSLMGDGGYPYGVPLDHWFCEEDGKLYFHGAREGHKIDAVKACNKASYCVYDEGYREEGDWALHFRSVIVFGRIRLVEDENLARTICTEIVKKFTDDEAYLEKELTNAFPRVQCLMLEPEHMSGKRVKES